MPVWGKGRKGFDMKHFCLLLAAVLVLFCAGCSSAQEAPSAGGTPDTTASANQPASTLDAPDSTPAVPDSTSAAPDVETGQSTAMSEKNIEDAENQSIEEEETEMRIRIQVNGSTFYAVPEENEAIRALVELMEQAPVTIAMSDYAGFEKVGPLGQSLPASDSQTVTRAGDIVLYNSSNIVIFYGSNSWSYTRLGHIEDLTGWEEALGGGDVTVTFSLGE